MLSKLTAIPFAIMLVFAGALVVAPPAAADDDEWGFSLGPGGLGFHYNEDVPHRYYRGYGPGYHYGGPRYYRPYRSYGYDYPRYYRRYYTPQRYYPGGLSFYFD